MLESRLPILFIGVYNNVMPEDPPVSLTKVTYVDYDGHCLSRRKSCVNIIHVDRGDRVAATYARLPLPTLRLLEMCRGCFPGE